MKIKNTILKNIRLGELVRDIIIARVVDGSDGSEISQQVTVVQTNIYSGRDFWTWNGYIGGHGPFNSSFIGIYDAGDGNVFNASTAFLYASDNPLYSYTAKALWYMSNDNSSWTLVAESTGDGTSQYMSINDTAYGRYLKIIHEKQPLNTDSLAGTYYNQLDLKIIKS